MSIDPEAESGSKRIRSVYDRRDRLGKKSLYGWHKHDVRYFSACKQRLFAAALHHAFGVDLSSLSVLDVGCGNGAFLRLLTEWGSNPAQLVGTEFLEDRLQVARRNSANEIRWRLDDLNFAEQDSFELVCAHTVFSSILDSGERLALANDMASKVKPGGWLMVFDFRYNNPSNPDVRKVTTSELHRWWSGDEYYYRTGLLAPPLARRMVGTNWTVAEIATGLIPWLRSHFVYMMKKS
jgi:SAM-dependent methyltransferase